jgi:hypothetical protein
MSKKKESEFGMKPPKKPVDPNEAVNRIIGKSKKK